MKLHKISSTPAFASIMLLLCLFLLPTEVEAAEIASGTCGDNLTWVLDDSGTLTISGTGNMNDFYSSSRPWTGSIKNVIIENGVTSIGDSAFYGYSSLTSVTIPDGVTSIGDLAFYDCSGLTSITIPDGVTSIGDHAFYDCSGLTSITIPSSVANIGDSAFVDCTALTGIWVDKDNTQYTSDEKGVLFNKDKSALIQCPAKLSGTYTIPSSVANIGHDAFYRCTKLTSITIPDSVTSIGDRVFYRCTKLTSITIPNSVTSIGKYAFSGCTGLTSITIPNSVTSIGDSAFYGCTGLTSITIPSSVTNIGDGAFDGCTGLTSITIPNSVTSIGYYAFSGCAGLTSITIPNSVRVIYNSTFKDCISLTSITIGTGVINIASGAFDGCIKLWHVLYSGSEQSWNAIGISSNKNGYFIVATRHYNCNGNEVTDPVNKVCTICNPVCTHTYDNNCDTSCNSCGGNRTVTHKYSTTWSKDQSGHWHVCSVCSKVADKAAHTPGAAATETTAQTCTTCGYVIKAALGHTHKFDTAWSKDASGHWHACACGAQTDYAVHSYKNSCDTDCDICGQTRTITHTPGPDATATTDQVCTVCGKVLNPATGEVPTDAPTEPPTDAPTEPVQPTEPSTIAPTEPGAPPADDEKPADNTTTVVVITAAVVLAGGGAAAGIILWKKKH